MLKSTAEIDTSAAAGKSSVERFVMREQPEKTYVAGHGIGRPGHPKEWTSTAAEPTSEDWDRWRNKAMQHCRWKKMVDLVFENNRWVWITSA